MVKRSCYRVSRWMVTLTLSRTTLANSLIDIGIGLECSPCEPEVVGVEDVGELTSLKGPLDGLAEDIPYAE